MNLVALVLYVLLSSANIHDLHLSKALVNYNEDAQSLEVSMHIFIDDLEMAMATAGLTDLYIATTKEDAQADEKISQYLQSVFQVEVAGAVVEFNFLGKETSDDLMAIWCYLEASEIAPPQSVTITNRLLLDFFDDQKNVVTFMSSTGKKYFLFDEKEFSGTIDL